MPMCKFGCDDLFEKGYLSVRNGKFVRLPKRPVTPEVEQYIADMEGKVCKYYKEDTLKYFDWHYHHHK